jgi:hypothetical protein
MKMNLVIVKKEYNKFNINQTILFVDILITIPNFNNSPIITLPKVFSLFKRKLVQ